MTDGVQRKIAHKLWKEYVRIHILKVKKKESRISDDYFLGCVQLWELSMI